jgi:hypothetical protein
MTARQLMSLSLDPAARFFKRLMLQVKLSWLYSDAAYFKEQEISGSTELAKTHKAIAILESDLRKLK